MTLEVADFQIPPGRNAEFEAAITRGIAEVLSKSAGYLGSEVRRGVESTERYLLFVHWATLEDHTVGFRQSPAFADWRAIVGPFFARPPVVQHFEALAGGTTIA